MARLKTAYRNPEKPPTETLAPSVAPDKPRLLLDTQIVEADPSREELLPAEPAVAVVSQDQYPEPNEAAEALKRQLEHLRTSEELQRRHAQMSAQQMAHAQPPSREQKIEMWKQQGMDPEDARFLAENPQMVDLHDVTRIASEEAAQHHQRGTDGHRQATKEIFDQHLARLQAQPAASAQPTPASTPEFFRPPPTPAPAQASPSGHYSAPVSRRDVGGPREPQSPRLVRLSPEEQEWARISGLSDIEYARHRLRLDFEKKTGQRQ